MTDPLRLSPDHIDIDRPIIRFVKPREPGFVIASFENFTTLSIDLVLVADFLRQGRDKDRGTLDLLCPIILLYAASIQLRVASVLKDLRIAAEVRSSLSHLLSVLLPALVELHQTLDADLAQFNVLPDIATLQSLLAFAAIELPARPAVRPDAPLVDGRRIVYLSIDNAVHHVERAEAYFDHVDHLLDLIRRRSRASAT